jgi:formylglycine-generating enzyme required for sulfatase activity
MALVPAGCFQMGSTAVQIEESYRRCVSKWGDCKRSWFTAESPQHELCFKQPFWIDRYEVTNKQYGSSGKFPGDDNPRDSVSWFDAVAFCQRRGGRLPTEAEWQYAARGPDGLVYPWGNTFEGKLLNSCDRNCTREWRDTAIDDGYATTSPVGSFPGGASWIGALDMSGNLWEWVSSIHSLYPYDATDGREADGNLDKTSSRLSFGGAWDLDGDHARLAFRNWNDPSFADFGIGFRCARPVR